MQQGKEGKERREPAEGKERREPAHTARGPEQQEGVTP